MPDPTLLLLEEFQLTHGASPSVKTKWEINGTDLEWVALQRCFSESDGLPVAYAGLVRQSVVVSSRTAYSWLVDVTYGGRSLPTLGAVRVSCSGNGGNATINRSVLVYDSIKKDDAKSYLQRETSTDSYGWPDESTLIGAASEFGDGGVELPEPGGQVDIEIYLPVDSISLAKVRELQLLIGRVNRAKLLVWKPHELMLTAVSYDSGRIAIGNEEEKPLSRLAYSFDCRFGHIYQAEAEAAAIEQGTTTGLPIASLKPMWKRGWDYLETFTRRIDCKGKDADGKEVPVIGKELIGAKAHQVAYEFDPKQLRIGSKT